MLLKSSSNLATLQFEPIVSQVLLKEVTLSEAEDNSADWINAVIFIDSFDEILT